MADQPPAEPTATFLFSKKSRSRPSALRKRPLSPDPSTVSEPSTSEVIIVPRKQALNHLIQGTSNAKRRRADADALALVSSDEEESSFKVQHSAKTVRPRRRSSSPPAEMSAESIQAALRPKGEVDEVKDDGMYHGSKGAAHKLPKAFGPVKGGPGNVRTITLVDYQPDVCKDYKETGFCGFGDTCKFLHDRGDYLHGWQLDNNFLSSNAAAGSFLAKQAARDGGKKDDDSDSEGEDLPFACLICRKPFGKDPVVTLCGHYFDAGCAVKRFAKTGKCFACGKGTNGVFNKATKLIAQVKEREKVAELAKAEEKEFEESDDEGVEIEGLERVEDARGNAEEEEEGSGEEEEEEEAPRPVRRRPIIEIQ